MKYVIFLLIIFLIIAGHGIFVHPSVKSKVINFGPTIEELMEELAENPQGGKIILPEGTYKAPSIYGENGLIQ